MNEPHPRPLSDSLTPGPSPTGEGSGMFARSYGKDGLYNVVEPLTGTAVGADYHNKKKKP